MNDLQETYKYPVYLIICNRGEIEGITEYRESLKNRRKERHDENLITETT